MLLAPVSDVDEFALSRLREGCLVELALEIQLALPTLLATLEQVLVEVAGVALVNQASVCISALSGLKMVGAAKKVGTQFVRIGIVRFLRVRRSL